VRRPSRPAKWTGCGGRRSAGPREPHPNTGGQQRRRLGEARSTETAIVLGGEGRSRQPWRRRGLSGRSRI
jgi:hypothetical protein